MDFNAATDDLVSVPIRPGMELYITWGDDGFPESLSVLYDDGEDEVERRYEAVSQQDASSFFRSQKAHRDMIQKG